MSAFDFEDEEQEIAKFKNRKKQKIELSKKIVINSTSDTPTRSNVTSIPISDEKTDKENENTEHKVVYIYSKEYSNVCSTLPTNIDRSHMVHSLVESYGLFDKMRIVKPILASIEELTEFHNTNYIKFLQMADSNTYDKRLTEEKVEDTTERHGLVDDCPIFENVFQYAQYVAGGTLTAAKQLTRKDCSIAINWDGGRHHAKKDKASGFCYVNDIVLGILQLMNDFERILYIDIDIHHGDGVEQAFYYTDRVFTLSFHHYSPGFFPGTGGIERTGEGIGELHSANVPLQEGLDDETFVNLFTEIVSEVDRVYNPLVIVMCCGADCLVNDRLGNWNLTHQGVGQCVSMVRKLNKKILMLGGGGYNNSNAARNWTNLTGLLVDEVLEDEIPEHDYFDQYGPDFKLKIRKGNRENMNTKERIEKLKNEILENVKELSLIKSE